MTVQPYPRTWADIDLGALSHNLGELRSIIDDQIKIALVAKADAYGHGLVPVSRFASNNGADWIAVATVQEGIALRDAGLDCRILVLSPMLPVEADQGVFYRLDLMVEEIDIATAISTAATQQGAQALVHLKVDTGLHRFGAQPEDLVTIAHEVARLPNLDLVGVSQHFIDSAQDHTRTEEQIRVFHDVLEKLNRSGIEPEFVHMANSAGLVKYPASRHNLVRSGILSYGIDPFNITEGRVQPVLRWQARISSVRDVPAGAALGYSSTYVTPRAARIATVAAGYGDGYPRRLSSRGFVTIDGNRAPIVGLVCMDQLLIDVSDLPPVKVGDLADLIGPDVRAEELARLAETNSHEIVTRIMSRVARRYIYPGDKPR